MTRSEGVRGFKRLLRYGGLGYCTRLLVSRSSDVKISNKVLDTKDGIK